MKKSKITQVLRYLRLIYSADKLRYRWESFKNRQVNRQFLKENPKIILPSDYLMYESFRLNYRSYYFGGEETAKSLICYLSKHTSLGGKRFLDWGCGPGRIIRHIPDLINDKTCEYYGTDYNAQSIEWCSAHLKGVSFNHNALEASLPYSDNFFDIIYGISIFTHLSEPMHYAWYKELSRVLKPGGIMLFTMHGDNFKAKMTPEELRKYERGEPVIRGKVKEGHRMYVAFHPDAFLRHLWNDAQVLEHICKKPDVSGTLPQDVWIIKINQ